mmetsp:Transcript_11755/g.23398  ORF Transcript_11755/g.23398 Transcript_11755/m.23398 type:complete len:1347 (+) Transcript_11755:48-4088(+)
MVKIDFDPSVTNPNEQPSHRLHDLLSHGQVEPALSASTAVQLNDPSLGIRLPLLLRWLSAAQSFASLSFPFDPSSEQHQGETAKMDELRPDPDRIVPLLEDVAASHPDAENVEVLVSTLAPSVCRDSVGKLPLLTRRNNGLAPCRGYKKSYDSWNTSSLDKALEILSYPNSHQSHSKRKLDRDQDSTYRGSKRQKSELIEENDMDDDISADEMENSDAHPSVTHRQMSSETPGHATDLANFFALASSAANDSHESAMKKTLQELLGLVSSSLISCDAKMMGNNSETNDEDGGGKVGGAGTENENDGEQMGASSSAKSNRFFSETGFLAPGISIKSDSLFAESKAIASSSGGGWSKLSVMVPALMHHAPIIRHEHVANALCRGAVPQAPILIVHMAANCPSAIPSLLRGCVTAYKLAEKAQVLQPVQDHSEEAENPISTKTGPSGADIMKTCIEATKKIASLSRCEAFNVIRMLKEENRMSGIVLDILISQDALGAATFIVENLTCASDVVSGSSHCQDSSAATMDQGAVVDRLGVHRRRIISSNKLSLRNRMICQDNRQSNGPLQVRQSSLEQVQHKSELCKLLIEDRSLSEDARQCISRCLYDLTDGKDIKDISMGEASLLIQAYALLILQVGIGAGSTGGSGSKFVEDTMSSILRLFQIFENPPDSVLPAESSRDNVYQMALCATITACYKFPPIGDTKGPFMGGPAVTACFDCLQYLLTESVPSMKSAVFESRIVGFIIHRDLSNFLEILHKIIHNNNSIDRASCQYDEELSGLGNMCLWLSLKIEDNKLKAIHRKGVSPEFIVEDPTSIIDTMRRANTLQTNNELDSLVQTIFCDPSFCKRMSLHPSIVNFVRESVDMLLRRPLPHIPLVLPLSLEHLARSMSREDVEKDHDGLIQFSLQLLYSMMFLDCESKSPFTIDPRLLPLKETLEMLGSKCVEDNNQRSGMMLLFESLKGLISNHCPDITRSMAKTTLICQKVGEPSDEMKKDYISPTLVCDAIRSCFCDGVVSNETAGMRAESMFKLCQAVNPCSEIDVAVVRAILTDSNSQPKFINYSALVKDPLVILKAKAAVWKCRGTRRIMLRVLQNLMKANEAEVMKYSTTDQVAKEFLTSRDAIIVRCLLFVCQSGFLLEETGRENSTPSHCVMSTNLIRSVVTQRLGIVATLIKQNLADITLDWLVEFIPESFFDSPILLNILLDRGSLSPTSRLITASAALRIAVANSSRGESITRQLASVSLSILIESFYLVIGPVGIPVSVLREDDGQDVTNICRKSMFRMVKTCASINAKSAILRNEATIALSKIAAMCKNESSGGVAPRRKLLLKEIWDACAQANSVLGGAMQI